MSHGNRDRHCLVGGILIRPFYGTVYINIMSNTWICYWKHPGLNHLALKGVTSGHVRLNCLVCGVLHISTETKTAVKTNKHHSLVLFFFDFQKDFYMVQCEVKRPNGCGRMIKQNICVALSFYYTVVLTILK